MRGSYAGLFWQFAAFQFHDAHHLLATLGTADGRAIQVVGEVGDEGTEHCRINATNTDGHTLSIVHADLGGAALELAERLGFDVMDS